MKSVFSEAIQIEKILIHDEKSLCMSPDMKITLLLDVVECTHPKQSISMALCQAFHERLLDFFNNHTEVPSFSSCFHVFFLSDYWIIWCPIIGFDNLLTDVSENTTKNSLLESGETITTCLP